MTFAASSNAMWLISGEVGKSNYQTGGLTTQNCDLNAISNFHYSISRTSRPHGCIFLAFLMLLERLINKPIVVKSNKCTKYIVIKRTELFILFCEFSKS